MGIEFMHKLLTWLLLMVIFENHYESTTASRYQYIYSTNANPHPSGQQNSTNTRRPVKYSEIEKDISANDQLLVTEKNNQIKCSSQCQNTPNWILYELTLWIFTHLVIICFQEVYFLTSNIGLEIPLRKKSSKTREKEKDVNEYGFSTIEQQVKQVLQEEIKADLILKAMTASDQVESHNNVHIGQIGSDDNVHKDDRIESNDDVHTDQIRSNGNVHTDQIESNDSSHKDQMEFSNDVHRDQVKSNNLIYEFQDERQDPVIHIHSNRVEAESNPSLDMKILEEFNTTNHSTGLEHETIDSYHKTPSSTLCPSYLLVQPNPSSPSSSLLPHPLYPPYMNTSSHSSSVNLGASPIKSSSLESLNINSIRETMSWSQAQVVKSKLHFPISSKLMENMDNIGQDLHSLWQIPQSRPNMRDQSTNNVSWLDQSSMSHHDHLAANSSSYPIMPMLVGFLQSMATVEYNKTCLANQKLALKAYSKAGKVHQLHHQMELDHQDRMDQTIFKIFKIGLAIYLIIFAIGIYLTLGQVFQRVWNRAYYPYWWGCKYLGLCIKPQWIVTLFSILFFQATCRFHQLGLGIARWMDLIWLVALVHFMGLDQPLVAALLPAVTIYSMIATMWFGQFHRQRYWREQYQKTWPTYWPVGYYTLSILLATLSVLLLTKTDWNISYHDIIERVFVNINRAIS